MVSKLHYEKYWSRYFGVLFVENDYPKLIWFGLACLQLDSNKFNSPRSETRQSFPTAHCNANKHPVFQQHTCVKLQPWSNFFSIAS